MSDHVEWSTVEDLSIRRVHESELPEAWLGGAPREDRHVLVLESVGNCQAFVLTGDADDMLGLAARIWDAVDPDDPSVLGYRGDFGRRSRARRIHHEAVPHSSPQHGNYEENRHG